MRRSIWMALLLMVPVLAVPAAASTFLAMNLGELVAESDAVVTGTVLKVESFRNETGQIVISQAMLQVDETVVGEAPTVVVLRTVGGTVDGYTVVAHGFPEFEVGERVLVFLSHLEDGSSEVVGYRLGEYKILTNRHGDEIAVPTLEPGVALLERDGGVAQRPQAARLEVLKQRIRREGRILIQDQGF